MDRSPPPFFRQGPSAHARLAFFAILSCTLLLIDMRLGALGALRQGIGTVLYPIQRALLVPREAIELIGDHLSEVGRLRAENNEMRRVEAANARALLQAEQLSLENDRLRELLGARERTAVRSIVAEILYETRDPYTRRVVIDRGLQHGVLTGQPVIDAHGVTGQVTRALPLSAEVTLLTDRNATIPVEIQRTGQRSIAFGGAAAQDMLELRFLNTGNDLHEGDALVTSGLDGIYPPGLPVGKVTRVEPTGSSTSFSRVLVQPSASMQQSRVVLVLQIDRSTVPPIQPAEPTLGPNRRLSRERLR